MKTAAIEYLKSVYIDFVENKRQPTQDPNASEILIQAGRKLWALYPEKVHQLRIAAIEKDQQQHSSK